MRSLCQIHHEHLVGDSLTQRYRKLVSTLLKLLASQHRAHRNDFRTRVRHFYTYRTFSRYRGNYTYSQCRKAQRYIILQISDFRYSHALSRSNLIQRHRRPHISLYRRNLYSETSQHLDNPVLVGILFLHVYARPVVRISLQQIQGRELIQLQIQSRVIRNIQVASYFFLFLSLFYLKSRSSVISLCRFRHVLRLNNLFRIHRNIIQWKFYAVVRIVYVIAVNLFRIRFRLIFMLEFGILLLVVHINDILFHCLFLFSCSFFFSIILTFVFFIRLMLLSEQFSQYSTRHQSCTPFRLFFRSLFFSFLGILVFSCSLFLGRNLHLFHCYRLIPCLLVSLRPAVAVCCVVILLKIRMYNLSHHIHCLSSDGNTYYYTAE